MATPKPETGVGETGPPDDGDTSGQELVAGLTAAADAVVEAAAAHPDVPIAMAALLAADVSGGHRGVHAVRVGLARNPAAKPAWLQALACDPSPQVRLGVAINPAAPTETLCRLALDPDPKVRTAVADNPAATPSIRAVVGLAAD